VRGAGHNDLLARPEVWQAIAGMFAELERPAAAGPGG
jgi:hypothetical protein